MVPAASERSRLIYLDHNATTPLAPQVIEVLMRHMGVFGNPTATDATWTIVNTTGISCDSSALLYCFQTARLATAISTDALTGP